MSLEEVIRENTKALNEMSRLLAGMTLGGKVKEVKKPEPVIGGRDPKGTRYYHIPEHNSVYKQLPGMPECAIASGIMVDKKEYEVQRELYQSKYAPAAPVELDDDQAIDDQPATAAEIAENEAMDAAIDAALPEFKEAPVVPAAPVFADVVQELKRLFSKFGNDELAVLLKKYNVKRVPELATLEIKFAEIIADSKVMFQAACVKYDTV